MLTERIADVAARIERACSSAARSPESVSLLAVTKTRSRDEVAGAIDAGLTVFGENRVQEAVEKYSDLSGSVELHLLGHLQSNKAKLLPGVFSWVESIDSLRIAEAVSRRYEAAGLVCNVLLQFNSSGEESKSGFASPEALLEAAEEIFRLKGVELRGVMTIGPFTDDASAVADAFRRTRLLFEQLRFHLPEARIDTLSMGMTDDMEIAIAEGSTEVRIGTALFGKRQ